MFIWDKMGARIARDKQKINKLYVQICHVTKCFPIISPILKSLVVPVIWLALIGAIYSRIAPFFALNHIFFPANELATLKT